MKFNNAYYIKLGEKGKWADNSIEKGIVRIGWKKVPINYINDENWDSIKSIINKDYDDRFKKNGATQYFNALKNFCAATENDIFLTFHKGLMYWCILDNSDVREDDISKNRKTKNGWSYNPINGSKKAFHSNEISGRISKNQAFQGTLCIYSDEETKIINRIINDIPNPIVSDIYGLKIEICEKITNLIKHLHWKDCEILVDLIFQQSGWRRVSMNGGSMEFMDMEYLDPINNERYIVQVKSGAGLSVYKDYEKKFIEGEYRKLFFIAFHPEESFIKYKNERRDVEILFGDKLSEMIFDLGLLNWVLKKSF